MQGVLIRHRTRLSGDRNVKHSFRRDQQKQGVTSAPHIGDYIKACAFARTHTKSRDHRMPIIVIMAFGQQRSPEQLR
jgi:hypothetical protein